jgi:hypothetical protein
LTANSTGGAVRSLRARRAKSRSKVSTRADPRDKAAIIASPKSIPPLYQDTARSVTARSSTKTRCRLSKASSARPMSARATPRQWAPAYSRPVPSRPDRSPCSLESHPPRTRDGLNRAAGRLRPCRKIRSRRCQQPTVVATRADIAGAAVGQPAIKQRFGGGTDLFTQLLFVHGHPVM